MGLIKRIPFKYEESFDNYFFSIIISPQSFLFQNGILNATIRI
jgi:hypothetical protein